MPKLRVQCPSCQTSYRVEDIHLGRKIPCKICSKIFQLQAVSGLAGVSSVDREGSNGGAPLSAHRAPLPTSWQVGDVVLDLYEVQEVLGSGGSGTVYKVRHRGWNIDLAVKSPNPGQLAKENGVEDFEREAEVWVHLGLHPHTVSCYYMRRLGGIPRVFVEYVEQGSLKDWIQSGRLYEGGPEQALANILDIAIQIAWGLQHAHAKGLIHQDVKPANVMMTGAGVAKVTDFGLAKARAASGETGEPPPGHTILASWGGMTAAYCSPEQAQAASRKKAQLPRENWPRLTRRTDIWSWAVTVLEMFTGEVTWGQGSLAAQALEEYLSAERGAPSGEGGAPSAEREEENLAPCAPASALHTPRSTLVMPPNLARFLRRCLQRLPEDRPRDMLEVVAELQEIYGQVAGHPYTRETPQAIELLADELNNRALSLLDLGRTAEAESLLTRVLQTDPYHPQATYNLGLLLWRSGRIAVETLIRKLEEVCRTNLKGWICEYLLACVHLERGDFKQALELLGECCMIDPEQVEVAEALDLARALAGEHEAQSTVDEAALLRPSSPRSKLLRLPLAFCEPESSQVLAARARQVADLKTRALNFLQDGSPVAAYLALTEAMAVPGYGRQQKLARLKAQVRAEAEPFLGQVIGLASARLSQRWFGHTDEVLTASFSPDGTLGLSGSADCTLRLWNVADGELVRTWQGHEGGIQAAVFSPDGGLVLSGSDDGTLNLWDVSSGENLGPIPGNTAGIFSLAFSPDGKLALSGSRNGSMRLWDVADRKCLERYKEHSGPIPAVAFSPDGQRALSAGKDGTLRLWDLAKAECVAILRGHARAVHAAAFSPDGLWILSASKDNTLRLWDAASGQWVRTFQGHTDMVASVAFSPDGWLALSGSRDQTLKLWEVDSARCLTTLTGHRGAITGVAFSPNGRQGLSASADFSLRLWEFAWNYRFREPAPWDEGARPYLRIFLAGHANNQAQPSWTEDDFQQLLRDLQRRGYGWLQPDGIRKKLLEMLPVQEDYD